jgi:hypothetical protein
MARCVSRASLGWVIAFSCGGVYGHPLEIFDLDRTGAVRHRKAFLQQRGDVLLAQPLAPAGRRRTIEGLVAEHHLATEVLEVRASTHRSHSTSSERLCMCLRMNSPATSLVGSGGCPGPTRHAELKCLARKSQSIVPTSRARG